MQTAVVTGATRGIGRAVAESLARRGFEVVVCGRDEDAGQEVVQGITARGGRARFLGTDLGSIEGARQTAEALSREERLDVLVHNAGLWPARCELGPDGLERSFVVNHVAPFVLNRVLEPRLFASRTRVVNVSSGLHGKGRFSLGETETGRDFHAIRTYASTKLASLLVMPHLAERWARRGPTLVAVHPGVIRTDLGARSGLLGAVLRVVKRAWKTPEQGAEPVVRLATDGDPEATHGAYFHQLARSEVAPVGRDRALGDALWRRTCELTGLSHS